MVAALVGRIAAFALAEIKLVPVLGTISLDDEQLSKSLPRQVNLDQ